jgi:pimeloyl-ACP methyl ester carboxylesterase/DNA-binding CsgD family transcriptional regulator
MRAPSVRLSELLRASAPNGAPVELLLDSWSQVEDAVLADTGHAREDFAAASSALPTIAGAIADRRTLAAAVLTAGGQVCFADPAYRALFRDSADLRPLLKRARREGPVVSLVEGAAGAAFTAWVGDAAAAARWPLDAEAEAALAAGPERLVVVVSAPSRSSELARRAARVLDLTALEARLAEALLFAPNLEVAAADAGVGRETARDALRRINAKAGVRRTPELIGRLIGVMCATQGQGEDDEALAETAFGLTPGEARVGAQVARGLTAPEAAQALGLSPETVKTHMKSVLQKTGAKGAKDFARLLGEGRELMAVAQAAESVFGEEEGGGRLRVVTSLDGARRIAVIDYGPYDGQPLLVFHGAAAGRRLPEAFRKGLVAAGLRPLVIQRPGFGLTDPAAADDYPATAAADMVAVIERLRLKRVRMLARDTGAPSAIAFALRHADLLDRVVLMNPHPPMFLEDHRSTFVASVQRHLLRNPDLVVAFAEFLRRQATTQLLERILDKALGEVETDHAALQDPAVRQFLIRDIQALCARSVYGFAAEHAVYANGWAPPADLPARGPWIVALSTDLPGHVDPSWIPVSDLTTVHIRGAGVLPQFTHPDDLVALVA